MWGYIECLYFDSVWSEWCWVFFLEVFLEFYIFNLEFNGFITEECEENNIGKIFKGNLGKVGYMVRGIIYSVFDFYIY